MTSSQTRCIERSTCSGSVFCIDCIDDISYIECWDGMFCGANRGCSWYSVLDLVEKWVVFGPWDGMWNEMGQIWGGNWVYNGLK